MSPDEPISLTKLVLMNTERLLMIGCMQNGTFGERRESRRMLTRRLDGRPVSEIGQTRLQGDSV